MDDERWQACEDPRKLLEWLRGRAGDRKLRLFVCAFWRSWWNQTADGGEAEEPDADLIQLLDQADQRAERGLRMNGVTLAYRWHPLAAKSAVDAANWTVRETSGFKTRLDPRRYDPWNRVDAAERQVCLLKDLFGNPFTPLVVNDRWRTAGVTSLARRCYADRQLPAGMLNPELLAVLADSLEDAGCDDPELLGHLRGPGPHWRGCWVVDLLLTKG
jgi:hypothetical protein